MPVAVPNSDVVTADTASNGNKRMEQSGFLVVRSTPTNVAQWTCHRTDTLGARANCTANVVCRAMGREPRQATGPGLIDEWIPRRRQGNLDGSEVLFERPAGRAISRLNTAAVPFGLIAAAGEFTGLLVRHLPRKLVGVLRGPGIDESAFRSFCG